MDEPDWLTCTDPNLMIRFLELGRKGTCRKLRLFGVACCRRLWRFLADQQVRGIVEVAERYADRVASAAQLRAAHLRSDDLCVKLELTRDSPRAVFVLANAALAANWVSASDRHFRTNARRNKLVPGGYAAAAASYVAHAAADSAFYATYEGENALALVEQKRLEGAATSADPVWAGEEQAQSGLLRCIFGNPFQPVPVIHPAWVAWEGGTVPKLAAAVYEERVFTPERLAVLADALEEAGCADAELLSHLRGPGPHARGCWAVDLLLGRG